MSGAAPSGRGGGRGRGGRGGRGGRSGPCYQFQKRGDCGRGAGCKFSHDAGPGLNGDGPTGDGRPAAGGKPDAGRGKGSPSTRVRTGDAALDRLFDKFTLDESVEFKNGQASRFARAVEQQDPAELLYRLTDARAGRIGEGRVCELVSRCASAADVDETLVPALRPLVDARLEAPLYRPRATQLLFTIYGVPGFDTLIEAYAVGARFNGAAAVVVCRFLTLVACASVEARSSEALRGVAERLVDRGVDGAARLRAIVEPARRRQGGAPAPPQPEPTAGAWGGRRNPPGGRHDNDFENYRDVCIVPTAEEVTCKVPPYLPLANDLNRFVDDDGGALLDKSYRLLRADFVEPLRGSLASPERRWLGARVVDVDVSGKGERPRAPSVVVAFDAPPRLTGLDGKQLRAYFESTVKSELSRGTLVCLFVGDEPRHFGTVVTREADWLADAASLRVGVDFERGADLDACLAALGSLAPSGLDLVQVSSSFFSYAPILKCLQRMEAVPLADELLRGVRHEAGPGYLPRRLKIPADTGLGLLDLDDWSTADVVERSTLDATQAEALRGALNNRVALVQGPPGTGKTFLGALVARIILENTGERILVLCQTNHALDQVLEDLLDKGVYGIARVGGRSKSPRLEPLTLQALAKTLDLRPAGRDYARAMSSLEATQVELKDLVDAVKAPLAWLRPHDLVDSVSQYLEDEDPAAHRQLSTPSAVDEFGFRTVGRGGGNVRDDDVWKAWLAGRRDTGLVARRRRPAAGEVDVWALSCEERLALAEEWRLEMTARLRRDLAACLQRCIAADEERQACRQETQLQVLRQARVVGATTTGAAMHKAMIDAAGAGVVLVEEAGEILEAHVLAALTAKTKHLILIGDHKQLRPKVGHHDLTVVANKGYDADCSLFERLALKSGAALGARMLQTQHRMRPEISALVRALTYPDLVDHASVKAYPKVRGLDGDVFFLDHDHPEDGARAQKRALEASSGGKSKTNSHEAEVVVELVRFLLLQGYKAEDVVVLTTYLGQLMKIKALVDRRLEDACAWVEEADQKELDAEADRDAAREDAINAVLGGEAAETPRETTSAPARRIRVSTVDNFQGEEADIVVISLVRSNKHGDVGFLKEAQRLNVLLSRARHGMILVGSAATIRASKKARAAWSPLFSQLEARGRVVGGLPAPVPAPPRRFRLPRRARRLPPFTGPTAAARSSARNE